MSDLHALPEVTRFVVKLPKQYAAQHADLRDRLLTSFPTRKFSFELADEAESWKISLAPVMEDAQGRAHVCRVPDRSLTSRIYDVMNEFIFGLEARPA